MTIGTIFTLFIVPSLYMLIAKEHHERRLDEAEPGATPTGDDDLEFAEPALAHDGDGQRRWQSE
jgi:hypothetical protein